MGVTLGTDLKPAFKHLDHIILREKNKRNRTPGKNYISKKQECLLVKEVGDSAAILYFYYYQRADSPTFNIKADIKVSCDLGWQVRKVQRLRWKLTNTGYIYTRTFYHPDGDNTYVTILGKILVNEYKDAHSIDCMSKEDYFTVDCIQCHKRIFR